MKKTAMVLAFLTLCPTWGVAATAEPQVLPNVVVTAGRIEEKATSVTQAVTVIPREEIAKNQHQDIGGLLSQYGIQMNSYNSNSSLSRTTIRGLSTELFGSELQGHVLILVDGRRSGTGLVALIPMVNIERIEILRGPASVQYGTSAMGGAINIITRRGTEKGHGMAEIGAGSFETFRGQGEVSGYLNGLDYSVGASLLTADDYKTGSGWLYENTKTGRKIGYNVNLGYNFLDEHRVGINAMGVDAADMGSPNDVRAHDLAAHTARYNYSFDMNYEGGVKDYGLNWQTRYFIGRSDYSNWQYGVLDKNKTDYQGTQGQLSFTKGLLTLTGGLDWTKYDLTDPYNGESTYKNTGYFLLTKLAFMEDLIVLSGGIRYDDYTLEMPGKDNDLDNFAPSVGLALNPLSWLTLRANYGESYIVPSAQQFLGYPNSYGPNYIGNPNLSPEKGKGWDAGVDLHYKSLNFVITYFQTDYKDKVNSRPVGANRQWYNISGTSKLSGIEAQASIDAGDIMDWPFMLKPYVNLNRMLKYEDENGKDIESVSKMDISYGIGFNHPGWGLDVDLRFIYYGRQNITDYEPVPPYSSNPDTIGGRTTADLYIAKTILDDDEIGTFKIKAEFKNIFDKEYYSIKEYPMPGRSFWLGLRYDY